MIFNHFFLNFPIPGICSPLILYISLETTSHTLSKRRLSQTSLSNLSLKLSQNDHYLDSPFENFNQILCHPCPQPCIRVSVHQPFSTLLPLDPLPFRVMVPVLSLIRYVTRPSSSGSPVLRTIHPVIFCNEEI